MKPTAQTLPSEFAQILARIKAAPTNERPRLVRQYAERLKHLRPTRLPRPAVATAAGAALNPQLGTGAASTTPPER